MDLVRLELVKEVEPTLKPEEKAQLDALIPMVEARVTQVEQASQTIIAAIDKEQIAIEKALIAAEAAQTAFTESLASWEGTLDATFLFLHPPEKETPSAAPAVEIRALPGELKDAPPTGSQSPRRATQEKAQLTPTEGQPEESTQSYSEHLSQQAQLERKAQAEREAQRYISEDHAHAREALNELQKEYRSGE